MAEQQGEKSNESWMMDKAIHATPAGPCVHYQRRRPEQTTLYQLVQEHIQSLFAQVEHETGVGLPEFVKDEFEAFLQCGILAHGFLRLRCADCAHEKLVAFSCCPQQETMKSPESRVRYLWVLPRIHC